MVENMPIKSNLEIMVANQMIKGPHPGRMVATVKQRDLFLKRHEKHINWAIEEMPRCSASVIAVVVKCIIKYGEEKTAAFCYALKHKMFQGPNDPVHLLWLFLQKHRGKDVAGCYRKTLCAVKAYMENKQITILRPIKEDIFKWNAEWTVPPNLTWNPDVPPKSYIPKAVEVPA